MAKSKVVFFCKECGYESSKWMGQCPGCKTWDTFVEEVKEMLKKKSSLVIAVSEGYKAKASCLNGIESVKKNAADGKIEKTY